MHVLIADDHELFRDGLRFQIETMEPECNITECGTHESVKKAVSENPDINLVLYDLNMPEGSWREGLSSLKKKADSARIVILSASEDPRDINDALDMEISGYIPKGSATRVLKNAVRLVMDGGTYLPPALLTARGTDKNGKEGKRPVLPNGKTLTPRQMEVLTHLSKGEANKQIAYAMSVSEATVKLHINALLRNLQSHNRTQAVVTAQKYGVI